MSTSPQSGESPAYAWVSVIGSLVLLIGFFDYISGYEWSFLLFYLIPVCLAVLQLGVRAGTITAFVSVVVWLTGDIWAGARYATNPASWWNGLIALFAYLIVIWLFSGLLSRQRVLLSIRNELEERVKERTAALTEEIAERTRLEKVVLETGERERRIIGHELHDGLGQHLTGVALAAKVLAEKLAERGAPEAVSSQRLVGFIEDGIGQTRMLAKGLLLVEVTEDGLLTALAELAEEVSTQAGLVCTFRIEGQRGEIEGGAATHLFRIAQEAVRNAVRHGNARMVEIVFSAGPDGAWELMVKDDGRGFPVTNQRGSGLGLRIMAHRAGMIGARFQVHCPPEGGTRVHCRFPNPSS